ncbi:MAG: hypothetical protein R3F65_01610 [bacterium]
MRAAIAAICLLTLNACVIVDDTGNPPLDFDAALDAAIEPTPDSAPTADAAPDAAAGCATDDDCEGARRCLEGRCVACFTDTDCVAGYLCAAGECIEGCTADAPCPPGALCADGACVPGCDATAPCPDDEGCVDGACAPCDTLGADRPPECPDAPCACAADPDCPADTWCDGCACQPGCRDDAGCDDGQRCDPATHACVAECDQDPDCDSGICDAGRCLPRGVGCRADADCNPGDRCDATRCVPAAEDCVPDPLEPNDDLATATALQLDREYDQVGICPGDVDLYAALMPEGATLRARLFYADPAPLLTMRLLDAAGAPVAEAFVGDASTFIEHPIAQAGVYAIEIRGAAPDVRIAYTLHAGLEAAPMCLDTPIYPDRDADGFGVDAGQESRCLDPGDTPPGFARQTGDCRPRDPWANPDAAEICNDYVDDDCDGRDARCPESQPAVQVPAWSCEDDRPPANVYAYARFDDGRGYFNDRGCFVFFEGIPGEYYVKRALTRASQAASCNQINGCTCPSLNGWPSYDRRLYAFTLQGNDPAACAPIEIIDHGGETQPVSNDCRKYLYQLHFYDIPYSFVAAGRATLDRRLDLFPTLEVACAADRPHANLPYQTLLTAPIRRNPDYRPL